MVAVESHARISDVIDIVIPAGFSRIPVYSARASTTSSGIVYVKDLMRAEREGREEMQVSTIMREAHFTPESKRVSELMREMQAGKFHMAIVVDEFGGTAGLVTLEDLIEELVGEITDEYDVEEVPPERLDDGDGGGQRPDARRRGQRAARPVRAARGRRTGTPWEACSTACSATCPYEGESAIVDGHRLVAERVQGRRIGRVRICPAPSAAPATSRTIADRAAQRLRPMRSGFATLVGRPNVGKSTLLNTHPRPEGVDHLAGAPRPPGPRCAVS